VTERCAYLAAAIRLYLQLPGAPRRASRSDWAVAGNLYAQAVPLDTLAHVFRLATLRRHRPGKPLEPVHSLAYYRRVLANLTPDALEPGYVDYVARCYQARFGSPGKPCNQNALPDRQKTALSDRR